MILIMILLRSCRTACGEGTLQCSPDDFPLVCDFTKSMILNEEGTECILNKIDGCLLPAFSSSSSPCFQCEAGKVLDQDKTKCLDVVTDKLVENCEHYDRLNSSCISCKDKFYLYQAKCHSVGDKVVENCVAYDSNGDCAQCKYNYYLRENSCFEFTTSDNCYVNTNRKCISCSEKYILNYANNPSKTITSTLKFDMLMSLTNGPILGDSNLFDSCQKILVTNCSVLKDFNHCKECDPGFFLTTDEQCELYPEQRILFCEKYLNGSNCLQCEFGYFKTASTCSKVTEKENCLDYNQSSGKCSLCESDYYLPNPNAFNPCIKRVISLEEISNCVQNSIFADECAECKEKYSLSQDNIVCLSDITDCLPGHQVQALLSTIPNHSCTQCVTGKFFNSSSGLCEDNTIIDKCQDYEFLENKCKTCKGGYYIAENKLSCPAQEVANCVTYVTEDKNECVLCESLFYVSEDKTECVALTKTAICHSSAGLIDQCDVCLQGYYKSGSDCVDTNTRPATQYDKNCIANNSTTNDDKCYLCDTGFMKADGISNAFKTPAQLTTLSCYKVKSDGTCENCDEGYVLSEAGVCSLTSLGDDEIYCQQHIANSTDGLDVNTDCLKCNTTVPLMYSDGTCVNQTQISSILGCGDTVYGKNEPCQTCSTGLGKYKYDTLMCSPITNDPSGNPIFSVVSDCIIHESSGKCKTCAVNKKLNNTSTACIDDNSAQIISPAYDLDLNPIGHLAPTGVTVIANCSVYVQISDTKIGCGGCNSGYIPIVSIMGSSTSYELIAEWPGETTNHTLWNKVLACQEEVDSNNGDANNSFKTSPTEFANAPGDCAIGYQISGKTGYGCYKCAGTNIGVWALVNIDSSGDSLDTPEYTLMGCSSQTSASVVGVGVGTDFRTVTNAIQLNNYISLNTCTEETESIVYMFKVNDTNGTITPLSIDTSDNGSAIFESPKCLTDDYFATPITSCQIYVLGNTQTATQSFVVGTDTLSVKCLECIPGFKLLEDGTCDEFDTTTECDVTGDNTWLSACQVPINSYSSTNYSGAVLPDFNAPHATNIALASDCLVTKAGDSTKCSVCKKGFWLQDNETCFELVADNELCSVLGVGRSKISSPSTDANKNIQLVGNIVLRKVVEDNSSYATHVQNYCHTCADNHVLLQGTYDQTFKCGKSDIYTEISFATENCEIEKFNSSGEVDGCLICSSTHLLNPDDNTCVLKNSHSNCLTIETSNSSVVCSKCADNYLLESDGTCTEHNCEEYVGKLDGIEAGDQCIICNSGMKFAMDGDSIKNDRCVANDNENDTCGRYSPQLEHCIKCKDTTKVLYAIYINSPAEFSRYRCETFDFTGNGYSGVNVTYPYIYAHSDSSGGTIELRYLNNDLASRTVITGQVGAPASEICIPKIVIENCKTYEDRIICTKCEDGYYLDTENQVCLDTAILNCLDVMDDDAGCNKCSSDYWIDNSVPSCKDRVKSLANCIDKEDDADECTSCDSTVRYLHSGECVEGTQANCVLYYETSDSCHTCSSGFYKNEDTDTNKYNCLVYTITGCGTEKHPYLDQCMNCSSIFWEHTVVNPDNAQYNYIECKLYSVTNCEQKHNTLDSCQVCNQGYKLQEKESIPNHYVCEKVTPLPNCSLYSVTTGSCIGCADGYYLYTFTNECRLFPDGIANCRKYSDRVTCIECVDLFFLNNNVCEEITLAAPITDCYTYSSATECSECDPSKNLILVENECILVLADNCATLKDRSTCETCIENHYLNIATGSCEDSNIVGCKDAVSGPVGSLCNVCKPGYLLNEAKTECNPPDTLIDNCFDYESQTKCSECQNGYYLLHNKTGCQSLANTFGSECTKGVQTKEYICDICEFGFEKNAEGVCVPYSDLGCAVIDIVTRKCLLCYPGESMDKSGDCTDPNAPEEEDKFISNLSSFAMIISMILLLKIA